MRDAMAELGSPAWSASYTIREAPTKNWHHGVLFDTYSVSTPANLDVVVREAGWNDGDYRIAVCFHLVDEGWVVLASVRHHKDTVW